MNTSPLRFFAKAAALGLLPFAFTAAQAQDTAAAGTPQAGGGSAPTIESNRDGKPDAWDRDGNGTPDAWDTNADGKPDAYDADGDGKPDGASPEPKR